MYIYRHTSLPYPGTEVGSISSDGSSMWSKPAKVVARPSDSSIATYFL